jgi:hypothetical protein
VPHPRVNPTPRAVLAGNAPAHPPLPPQRPAVVQRAPIVRPGPPATTARNLPPNEPTLAPPAKPNTAVEAPRRSTPSPLNERTNPAAVPHPPASNPTAVDRGLAPSGQPPLVSKYPPPRVAPPFAQRAPAMAVHPGRPLEPQQLQNMYAGRPAGPMVDHEFPPHAPAMRAAPAPHPAPAPPKH